jgi:hypothetical protein
MEYFEPSTIERKMTWHETNFTTHWLCIIYIFQPKKDINCMFSTFFTTSRCDGATNTELRNMWLEVWKHNASYVHHGGLNDVDHTDLDKTSVSLKRQNNENWSVFLEPSSLESSEITWHKTYILTANHADTQTLSNISHTVWQCIAKFCKKVCCYFGVDKYLLLTKMPYDSVRSNLKHDFLSGGAEKNFDFLYTPLLRGKHTRVFCPEAWSYIYYILYI